jgi:hypothetical protein
MSDLEKKDPSEEGPADKSLSFKATTKYNAADKFARGIHPGFGKLKSEVGVYRTALWRVLKKARPEFADFSGVLVIGTQKIRVFAWLHENGSLGLRLQKIIDKKESK